MKKFYYYSFAFQNSDGRKLTTASIYIGYNNKLITRQRIDEAKTAAFQGLDVDKENSVMLSCCYLGKMTEKEMIKKPK